MGIFALTSYMEKNPHMYYKIDLLNCVNNNTNRNNIIVIDASACLSYFYSKSYIDILANGQYQSFYNNIIHFTTYFINRNIKLVAVFDGRVIPKKRDVWVKRRMNDFSKVLDILDALEANKRAPEPIKIIPTSLNSVARRAFKRNCEIIVAYDEESDSKIIKYANENNVLAVISQDSDFLMCPGAWDFWSVKDINIDTHSTYVYDKKALAKDLGIQENQLPLFATLAGNDFINLDMLKRWHHRLLNLSYKRNINRYQLFYRIAHFVKRYNCYTLIDNCKEIENISLQVFGNKNNVDLIQETIMSYMGITKAKNVNDTHFDNNWNTILEKVKELRCNNKICSSVFSVFMFYTYEKSTVFDDPRKSDLPLSGLFWRRLRAKIYGICFANHPDKTISVEEWVSAGFNSLDEATYVNPIKPDISDLNILDILNDDTSQNIKNIRYTLFCNSIENIIDPDDIHKIPKYLLPCFIVVAYMMHYSIINTSVVKYFLQVTIACNFCNNAECLVNKNDVTVNPKALRLATICLCGFKIVRMLSDCCGYLIEKQYFGFEKNYDGILFHYLYNGGILKDYNEHPDLLKCLDLLKQIS